MYFDIVIVGAGPAGLCVAKSLAECGMSIAILERQSADSTANPAFDGREIALTQDSIHLLKTLGFFNISTRKQSPLRDARVLNGPSLYSMTISHRDSMLSELGFLVANQQIRKAAYQAVQTSHDITLMTDVEIAEVQTHADIARVTLKNGEIIESKLLIAADNRFSETRRMMGISATMHDFGKTMMVCTMTHDVPHHHVAWEWFDYGQTLALLPMNGMRSSVVITLAAHEIQTLMSLPESDFNENIQRRFKHRLGNMQLASTRHAYPLVTVYPERFVATRFALIGDAAVGMHPVTAHGFNFGLRGIASLSSEIKNALASKSDFASPSLLSRYDRKHRQTTRPLFIATHAIAKFYSDDRLPARLVRQMSIHIGNRVSPFKRTIAKMLTSTSESKSIFTHRRS